ncbi:glycerol dehydratase, cobalamin-independent, small subunit [Acetitomaculum ruminis DSM 5522]|uniref:Glycerol dehydratase, cobalamin-independent, small subunit n=1 Tax=Acetitomaculum ruminis DSM 5522 TaxID=1120918 RepID=A0A1I0W0I6_9FIRM|nr:glycyl-radical enzyme activating protein [Acetitomaculum ruminis]SFA82152.1 glycerol dehydratase, cobalamin-independent, small subunit [Acetitomaculum ruminis DSM 5522]
MDNKQLTGRLYDIQGFSVQDGPGVRTTAFLKGCPLRCPWCHSPESQSFKKQLSWMSMRCLGTKACNERCIKACPKGAIELGSTRMDPLNNTELQLVHVKRDLCDDCGICTESCYAEALYLCGKDYTVDELVDRLLQDRHFYETSDGGVTISGGEALCQVDFVVEVLKRLKEEGIHTALDTTGYADWEVVEKTLPYVDIYLYDLKHMDSEKHKAVVKVPNEKIKANAIKLAEHGKKLQIRIPVIPLFNHDEENIRETAEFCQKLGDAVEVIQLLPYHNLGVMKYLRISDEPVAEATPPSEEYMEKLKGIMESYGLPVTIH